VLSTDTEPPVTEIERRGIEHVPQDARWGKPSSLFWMWAGAVWNIEFLIYGVLAVVVFGLSFAQAVLVILIGNLSYVLTGLASLQGPRAGTTTFAISRAPFGPNGNRLPSLFNWATQVGFEIEGIALVVFAGIALASRAGFMAGTAAKVVFVILAVAIQAVLPLLGHAAVLRVLKWLAIPFVILSSWRWSSRLAAWAGRRTPTTTRGTCRRRRTTAGSCSPWRSGPGYRRCSWRFSGRPWRPGCRERRRSRRSPPRSPAGSSSPT
jgi:purine-cytosine permease-like protein